MAARTFFFNVEQRIKNMEATYKWTEYFTRERRSCRCEIVGRGRTGTTATIVLKEYGPKGKPPGTRMNVKMSSVGLKPERQEVQGVLDWHAWTDI